MGFSLTARRSQEGRRLHPRGDHGWYRRLIEIFIHRKILWESVDGDALCRTREPSSTPSFGGITVTHFVVGRDQPVSATSTGNEAHELVRRDGELGIDVVLHDHSLTAATESSGTDLCTLRRGTELVREISGTDMQANLEEWRPG